ncbi:hypothetical protein K445DRAFT_10909 [Daldinia sp. EC12]|nr:hypothetical protein K445DRAFT_10909 [Daldinia sp. EC12]
MRPRGTRLDLWKKDLEFHMLRNMLRRQQWGEAGSVKQLASEEMKYAMEDDPTLPTNMLPGVLGCTCLGPLWASYNFQNLKGTTHAEPHRGVMVAEGHCGHLSSLGIPCSVYRSTVCTSKMYTMHVPCFVSSQSSRTKLIWGRWKSSRGLGWGAGSTNLELVREPPIGMYMVEFAEPSVNKTHDFNSWFA